MMGYNIKQNILKEINKHEVISFDIFDTLILRPYIKPTDVFLHIEKLLCLKNYAQKRLNAEIKARRVSKNNEISYDEIYNILGKYYKERVYQFELDFEKRICQRNEEIYAVYQYALEKKKRIVFITDMYLPEFDIREILDKSGFATYEYLFLSSVYKKRKSSGKLYDVVLEILNVKPEKILHIGDNIKNDVEMALSKGFSAIHYPKVIDRFLEAHPNMYTLLGDNTDKRFKKDRLTLSLIMGLNAIIFVENKNSDYWTELGSLYAAPLLYHFTKRVYDNAKTRGIKNIALVARDGFNLIKIFNLFDNKKEFNTQYVYLPRYISEVSNINSEEDIHFFLSEMGKTHYSLYSFIQDISKENRQINLKWDNLYCQNKKKVTYDDMKSFILSNKKLFIDASFKRRNIVYDYLKNKNLLNNDLIIVDSSCTHARPQKLLRKIISDKKIDISLYGFYYKLNKKTKFLNQIDIKPNKSKKYHTDRWDLMEYFFSSPEKPILSIKKDGNNYKPIFQNINNNRHEEFRIKTFNKVTDGLMQFVNKTYKIFDDKIVLHDLDTIILHINNLINNPSVQDISNIVYLQHSPFNDNKYKSFKIGYNKKRPNRAKAFAIRIYKKISNIKFKI
jgi:HAD superfamily hydrolase (TIGR01549 family)